MNRRFVSKAVRSIRGPVTASIGIQSSIAISGVLVARTLGVEDRGFLALLVLIPTLTYQLGGLGVPVATAYFIASAPTNARAIVGRLRPLVFGQIVGLAALHAAVIAAVLRHQPGHVVASALISLTFVPLALLQHYGLVVVQGLRRHTAFNALRLVPPALYAASVAAATLAGIRGLTAVAALWITSFGAGTAATLLVAFRSLPARAEAVPPPTNEMIRFGLRGLIGSSSPLETFRVDQLLVAVLLTPAALGLYVVAMAFTNLPMFVAQSFGMVAFPEVAARSPELRARSIWSYAGLAFVVCGTLVLILEITVDRLLPFLFGQSFAGAIPTARLLLGGALALGLRRVLADGARGAGRPGLSTLAEVVGWIALFPLAVLLAPRMGVEGVAIAFSASALVSLFSLGVLMIFEPSVRLRFTVRAITGSGLCLSLVGTGLGIPVVMSRPTAVLVVMSVTFCAVAVTTAAVLAKRTRDILSPLTLVTVYYVLGFSVGGAYYWRHRTGFFLHRFSDQDLIAAIALGFLAWSLFTVGYVAALSSRISRRVPAISFRQDATTSLIVPLLGVGWLCRILALSTGRYFHSLPAGSTQVTTTGSGWLVVAGSSLPLLVCAYVGSRALQSGSRRLRLAFFFLIVTELAWNLPTGDRGSVIAVLLTALAVAYYATGRMPWRPAFAAVAFGIFVVLPFGLNYRGDNAHYQTQPTQELRRAAGQYMETSPGRAMSAGLDATLSRFADAASVAVVFNRGRADLDRPAGATLSWALTAFVPRAIAPNKADPGRFGNEFGRKYGILAPADHVTSVSIGEAGEFYMNFGLIGILLGMPIVGALYQLLGAALRQRRSDARVAALYAVLAWPLIQSQGTIFAQGFLGVAKLVVALFGLLWVVHLPANALGWRRGSREVQPWMA